MIINLDKIDLPDSWIEIFKDAWAKFGEIAQLDMIQEECAELIFSVAKFKRYHSNPDKLMEVNDDIIEEIADVFIMCLQFITCRDFRDELHSKLEFKMNRLKTRLNS